MHFSSIVSAVVLFPSFVAHIIPTHTTHLDVNVTSSNREHVVRVLEVVVVHATDFFRGRPMRW